MKFDIELVSYNDNEHTLIVTPEIGGKEFRHPFISQTDDEGHRSFGMNGAELAQLRNYIARTIFDNPPAAKVCFGCGVAEGQVCKRSCHIRERREAVERQQVEEATEKYKKILKKKEMPVKKSVAQGPTTEEQQSRADAEDSLPENRKPEIDTRKPEAETGDSLYVFQPPVHAFPPTAPAADCGLCAGTGRLLVVDETVDPDCYRMMWCPCVHRHASSSSPSHSSDVEDRGPIEDTGPTQEDVRDERGSSSEASEEVYEWKTCRMNHEPEYHNRQNCRCGRMAEPYDVLCSGCRHRVMPDKAGLCPVCDSQLLDVPEAT